ncbi:MAG: DUF1761 domain-containing protein [Candidatus Saccharimonadales bacterium]
MDVTVNYWAIVLAAVSSMVVGSIWYARSVFGDIWAKLAHVDMNKKQSGAEMAKLFGSVFVASLVTAYILAHVTFLSNEYFQNDFFQDAVSTAFWLWLGLTAARILTHDLFESRPFKLTLLTFGNEFVTIMVMGVVIGLMGIS